MSEVEVVHDGLGLSPTDQEAVLQLSAELDRTWNARDAHAFAGLFDENGDFRFPDGLWIQGREAIELFWKEKIFPLRSREARHVVTSRRVRFVTEDVVIGEGTLRIVETVTGQEQVYFEAEGTLLAVKRDLHWRIASIRLAVLVKG